MPKRALLVGSKDAGKFFECSRYTWWNHRQCQTSLLPDRKFSTRRLAALYVAKQNSDELSIAAREAGKTWEELVPSDGVYAVRPHAPFRASAVDDFLELSDDELELYGNAVAAVFDVLKISQGTVWRAHAKELAMMGMDEVAEMISCDREQPQRLHDMH